MKITKTYTRNGEFGDLYECGDHAEFCIEQHLRVDHYAGPTDTGEDQYEVDSFIVSQHGEQVDTFVVDAMVSEEDAFKAAKDCVSREIAAAEERRVADRKARDFEGLPTVSDHGSDWRAIKDEGPYREGMDALIGNYGSWRAAEECGWYTFTAETGTRYLNTRIPGRCLASR